MRRTDRLLLSLMLFAPVSVGFAVVEVAALSCYAHVPAPSCADDPTQPGCYPPLQDERADGGR
ncbi:MAG TPA: hypothetical protein VN697_03365 [Tepidiformaceae bacterium]|nr:hypothetical protein [Tepidiformaceae bacterium]